MTAQGIISSDIGTMATSNISKKSENVNSKTDSFSKVMEKSNYENPTNHIDNTKKSDFRSSKSEVISHKHMHQINSNQTKQNTTPKGFVKEEFIADVETALNDIANSYKENLDLSDDELISIMEELAINIFQLPMQEYAKDIVVLANGENDITSLLVNEKALMDLQSMNQFFDKFNSETRLNIPTEELQALVKEAIDNLVAMKENVTINQDVQTQNIQLDSDEISYVQQDDVSSITDDFDLDSLQNNSQIKQVEAIDIGNGKTINIEIVDIRQNMTKDNNLVKDIANVSKQQMDLNKENMLNNTLSENVLSTDNVEIEGLNQDVMIQDNTTYDGISDTKIFDEKLIESDKSFNPNEAILGKEEKTQMGKEDIIFEQKTNSVLDETINNTFENSLEKTLEKTTKLTTQGELDGKLNSKENLNINVDNATDTTNATDIEFSEDLVDMDNGFDLEKDNIEIHSKESNDEIVDTKDTSEDVKSENLNSDSNNESFNESSSKDFTQDASESFYDKFITNLEKSFGIDEGSIMKEVSHLKEMQEVVNQLVEKIKVHISKESTTMKLNLNPEHLGKVELEVTSKSGVLTADFVVESETAKEALEKGLPTLLEKFHEQGLKVEAVEVSIAEYDFTRQDGERKSKSDYGQEDKKKKRNGKISLDDMTTSNEVVQEEKQIMSNKEIDYSV